MIVNKARLIYFQNFKQNSYQIVSFSECKILIALNFAQFKAYLSRLKRKKLWLMVKTVSFFFLFILKQTGLKSVRERSI